MFRMVLALVRKEFYQVRRDPVMLRIIFLMPIIQLLLLGYAINTDVKNIRTAVYDYDRSDLSREFMRSLGAGGYFVTRPSDIPLLAGERGFRENRQDVMLVIPPGFSRDLKERQSVTAGFLVDGTNASSAAVAMGYANLISAEFNRELYRLSLPVTLRQKVLYNPEAESVYFMVPAIVAILLTMVTVMLMSMAIVREREIGTLEQLLVTPITKPALLLGKAIPFSLIGLVEFSIALVFGVIWFGIPFAGSWTLLYLLAFIFLFTTLGVGIFISTITKTQQQAMFFAWFFSIFAILTSGFFIPIQNMPQSIQYLTYLNPVRYFLTVIRGIMMKGVGLEALYPNIIAMIVFSVGIFTFAWLRFAKRTK
ncbi:MAG: ABC transporter permease [candidate division Zixibacteria bacterium]|nr:ABC transporter permease [candidate division Zixibacteria bacterium]